MTLLNDDDFREALAWSRHYDYLLWVVTALFAGANAALLAISSDKLTIQVGLLGVGLSVLAVFFAASFRAYRRALHETLDSATGGRYAWLRGAGGPFWAGQWIPFLLLFAGMAALWLWMLLERFPAHRWWWIGVAVVCGAALLALLFLAPFHTRRGRSVT